MDTIILRSGQLTLDRKLDLVFDKDERNRGFGAMALAPTDYERVDKAWPRSPVTNQGGEGACVGHGCTGCALAFHGTAILGQSAPNDYAYAWYHTTQHGDDWQGCSKGLGCDREPTPQKYDGTSVKHGGRLGVHRGLFSEFRWAFGIDEVLKTLTTIGPVCFGIPWHEGMYEAPGGILTVTGPQVGAHCIKGDEINWTEEYVVLQNSWGLTWGVGGRARVSFETLDGLLRNEGEAMVPIPATTGALSQ